MGEEEIIKKFGIDKEKLSKEQVKLANSLELRDSINFNLCSVFGGIETTFFNNKIIAGIVICDSKFEIIEQQFFMESVRFPYLFEFRSYRELPAILGAFEKLQNKPDVFFIRGHGITHPRLGLASHFSLFTGVPCIGVAENIFDSTKIEKDNIFRDDKKVGRVLLSKEKSNPIYISPGNKISINSAYDLCKKLICPPHKMPEPLNLAHKYIRTVHKELAVK